MVEEIEALIWGIPKRGFLMEGGGRERRGQCFP
jgi:hypothetical protein